LLPLRVPVAGAALALVGALAGGCLLSPLPDLRTPADRAHDIEPRCEGVDEAGVVLLLSPKVVDTVKPAYTTMGSGPVDREARLRGSRIELRPLPGMSSESLTRTLECHQVRATLGQTPSRDDDPYVLPGRWVDIDVDSGKDGFVVLVRGDTFEQARQILERARRFVRVQPPQ
jgi:hypothetical protein